MNILQPAIVLADHDSTDSISAAGALSNRSAKVLGFQRSPKRVDHVAQWGGAPVNMPSGLSSVDKQLKLAFLSINYLSLMLDRNAVALKAATETCDMRVLEDLRFMLLSELQLAEASLSEIVACD